MGSIRHIHAEKVYLGRDNTIDVLLTENDEPITDYTPIMRITLQLGQTTIDSDVNSIAFEWLSSKRIIMKLGSLTIPAASYKGTLVTYDKSNTDGLVWSDDLPIVVIAATSGGP